LTCLFRTTSAHEASLKNAGFFVPVNFFTYQTTIISEAKLIAGLSNQWALVLH